MSIEIKLLPGLETVRRRPAFYISKPSTAGLAEYVIASLAKSSVSILRIEILQGCGIRIDCNRCLLPFGTSKTFGVEQPIVLQPLLGLMAPGPDGFVGALPVLNALSKFLRVSCVDNKIGMTIEASRGGLIGPVRVNKVNESQHTMIEFEADQSILTKVDLAPSSLHKLAISCSGADWTVECIESDERLNAARA